MSDKEENLDRYKVDDKSRFHGIIDDDEVLSEEDDEE